MSAPAKQSSRWGSFLQQAVAGVESRLDNILTDADESGKATKPTPSLAEGTSLARSSSNSSRTNDRLQERLARAVAAKNAGQKSDSLTGTPSRSGVSTPVLNNDSQRLSLDASSAAGTEVEEEVGAQLNSKDNSESTDSGHVENSESEGKLSHLPTKIESLETSSRLSTESARSSVPRVSVDSARQQALESVISTDGTSAEAATTGPGPKSTAEYDALLKQLQSDFEISELQRQEEVHSYVERIDALEAKLQYLARESADSARAAINSAPPGSLEKKLAEKEEQVSLLMEEGQKLSKKELAHLTTIKKLRVTIQEHNKELAESKKKQEKAERDASSANDRLKRAVGSERLLTDKQRLILQLQKENESLKAIRDLNDATIADLRAQLDAAVTQSKQVEIQLANEALEAEKRRMADLEEDVANLKIENGLVADRAQAQMKELREKMDKDAERSRMTELEMKTEQQMLESKLEVMRARAEEVSSGATGDAQAKLLRQIETLQTQYAVAGENWQGIEASLIARAASLEKERDEATRREADVRRKARDVALKVKRSEDELEDTRSKLPALQQELEGYRAQLDGWHKRAKEAESALAEARAAFDQEKQSWQAELLQRIDEERQKWQEETTGQGSFDPSRANSPVTSTRRVLTSEYLGLQNLQVRRASARSVNSDIPTADRFPSRRPSAQPVGRVSGQVTPARQDSMQSTTTNTEVPDAPSVHTDNDDVFESYASPASPHQTINDMVSVSTAAAGPSIQLVERMSSAVRRLESEKAAAKDDLSRLTSQRDEARAEIIILMKEVEAAKGANSKIADLELEIKEIKGRYETTLEMLGEKSERVDELESDIVDLKDMYRELVERTVK